MNENRSLSITCVVLMIVLTLLLFVLVAKQQALDFHAKQASQYKYYILPSVQECVKREEVTGKKYRTVITLDGLQVLSASCSPEAKHNVADKDLLPSGRLGQ